eukprot:15366593-Ditylum_brightwellii.AAC.1
MGNVTAEQVLKAIMNAEDMAQVWKRICFADKGMKENNLTSTQAPASWPDMSTHILPNHDLEDPNQNTEWKTIELPQDIVHYLNIGNRRHVGQAQGTPFTIPPLSQYFDWSVNFPISEWESSVRAWCKATTTFPSGQHLRHFKVLVHRHSMPLYTDEGQELSANQNELVDAHTEMMQYALDKRYSYIRWQNIVNIVMGKEVGSNKIHRTRILPMYKADYSVCIGLMWKGLLSSSEKRGTLNRGLHWDRCGHNAQALSLI